MLGRGEEEQDAEIIFLYNVWDAEIIDRRCKDTASTSHMNQNS